MDAKTLAKYLIGGPELLASAVTGAAAEPIAGWGGILAKTLKGEDKSAQAVEGIRDALTYQPRSPVTAELAGDLGDLTPDIIKELASKYSALQDEVGAASPTAGAAMATIPAAAGMLFPYAGRVKAIAENVPDTPLNRQAGILRGLNDEEALLSPGVAALKQGGYPAEVWQDYGVGEMPGMPGKYFDEIDDSAATIDRGGMSFSTEKPTRLPNFLKHPEMYSATPPMRYTTQVAHLGDGEAFWDHKNLEMGIFPGLYGDDALRAALHEAQHGVAGLTGLPGGTVPSQEFKFYDNVIKKVDRQKKDLLDKMQWDESFANDVYKDPNSPYASAIDTSAPEWEEIKGINDYLSMAMEARKAEYLKYKNDYGEALARQTEARRLMTKEDRRASYPFEENTFQRESGSSMADVLKQYTGGGK